MTNHHLRRNFRRDGPSVTASLRRWLMIAIATATSIAIARLGDTDVSNPWTPVSVCQALSSSSSSNTAPGLGKGGSSSTSALVRLELFDPTDEARLGLLRDCRRTAYDASKTKFLNSERDFINAQSVVDGKNLCVVAISNDDRGAEAIVGSADLAPSKSTGKNVVTNVFVRPDLRGTGLGRRLMLEGVETMLVNELPEGNLKSGEAAVLSLDVYTQNKPAFGLYEALGYEPSSPVHAGTLTVAKTFNSNLLVSLSKTVPVENRQ